MNYFDITRLAKRADAPTPSGIDRVDLAYLAWLRGLGTVRYLVNGMSGFTQIPSQQGDLFFQKITSKWKGLEDVEIQADFHDKSHRYRMVTKWLARRRKLAPILAERDMNALCRLNDRELDLLDVSANRCLYRVDPPWKRAPQHGCFFGIDHSLLTRTAYMAELAKHKDLKRIFFIHDTIPCDFPQFCQAHEGARHLLRIRNAFRYGSHIIVNSEYTRQRLDYWRKSLGENDLPVEVIPIGVDDGLLEHSQRPPAATSPARPYFVAIGTIEPRKNHALLLDLWREMASRSPKDEIPDLVIIGRRGWKNKAVFDALDHDEILSNHIREMNGITDEKLWPILRGACAMLFPSHVEGWGMPLVEALTLGVPVIASDVPAFHEAGQGVPDLVDLADKAGWMEKIRAYADASSSPRVSQLSRLGKFRPPTWTEHFNRVSSMIGNVPTCGDMRIDNPWAK